MNPKTLFFLLGLLVIIHSVVQTIEGSLSQRKHNGRKRNEVRQRAAKCLFFLCLFDRPAGNSSWKSYKR